MAEKSPSTGDVFAYYFPVFHTEFSLWEPGIYAGFPKFADPQFQLWYPLTIFFRSLPHGWALYNLSGYVLASTLAYAFCLKLTYSHKASALGGFCFSMSGFMLMYQGYTSVLHAAAWLPLLLLSIKSLSERISFQWALAGIVSISCMLLAGHPQITLYGLILSGCYLIFLSAREPRTAIQLISLCGVMLLLGIGLSAIQLIPTLEFSILSVRSNMTFDEFTSSAFEFKQAIRILFPYHSPPGYSGIALFGIIGLSPILLSIGAIIVRKGDSEIYFWVGVACTAFFLSLGDATPLGMISYHIPVLNKFRAPVRHFLEVSMAVSVLAAFTVSEIERGRLAKEQLARIFYLITSIGFLLSVATCAAHLLNSDDLHAFTEQAAPRWSLFFGMFYLLAFLLIFAARHQINREIAVYLLIVICIVDLSGYQRFLQHMSNPASKALESYVPAVAQHFASLLSSTHHRLHPVQGVFGDNLQSPNEVMPNASLVHDISSISGYGPLILSRYSKLLGIDNYGRTPRQLLNNTNRSLDILSTKYVFLTKSPSEKKGLGYQIYPNGPISDKWTRLSSINSDSAIFENRTMQPRAWFVSSARVVSEDEALLAISRSKFRNGDLFVPEHVALVERNVNCPVVNPDPSARVELLNMQNDSISLRTTSAVQRCLILSDVYYPGWIAKVDGETTEVFPANYLLRGIVVPAGRHTIEFEFKPTSLRLGQLLTLISLFLSSLFLFWLGRNGKSPASTQTS